MNTMMGILSAKNSVGLAAQNQRIANSFVNEGRVRERHAATVGDEDGAEKAREMQAKGEKMRADTYEYLQDASSVGAVSDDNDESEVLSACSGNADGVGNGSYVIDVYA
jgi:3-hydroxyisobutyrate dehydrogenase-like beta-hydroxyacid dehydrogenase